MKKPRSGWPLFWHIISITFSVVLVTVVLGAIALYIFLAIGMNAWASNK